MDNFDSYNVLLTIATNIPVLLMTAFVLQGHIFFRTMSCFYGYVSRDHFLERFDLLVHKYGSHSVPWFIIHSIR